MKYTKLPLRCIVANRMKIYPLFDYTSWSKYGDIIYFCTVGYIRNHSRGVEYNDCVKRLEYPVESRSKGLNSPLCNYDIPFNPVYTLCTCIYI